MAYAFVIFYIFTPEYHMGKSRRGACFGEAWRYSMEISTFKVKVQKAVSEVLGQEYTVELREVQKNNGVLLQD